jgi:hypothetical protein
MMIIAAKVCVKASSSSLFLLESDKMAAGQAFPSFTWLALALLGSLSLIQGQHVPSDSEGSSQTIL